MAERVAYRGGRVCSCLLAVFPKVEEEFLLRGMIADSIDVTQWSYSGAAASMGTHLGGGTLDISGQYTPDHLHIWRSWGVEMQDRSPFFAYDHAHGVVKGCDHLSSAARAQARSWEIGRDGLAQNGFIDGPGPKGKDTPTWQQALKERGPIVAALKDELKAAMLTEAGVTRGVLAALQRDGVVDNLGITGNPKNPTIAVDTALAHIGRRVNNLEVDLGRIQTALTEILSRLPKETTK